MSNDLQPQYSDIIFYTSPEGNVSIEVIFNDETFWLSQKKMAELFSVDVRTVNGFLKVESIRIKNTTPGSNQLQFGQNKTNIVPYTGLISYGPYSHCPFPHVNMFFICHEGDKDKANLLYTYFLIARNKFLKFQSNNYFNQQILIFFSDSYNENLKQN